MAADPTLVRLTAEVDRAVAALRAYVEGAPADPEDDFVSLKDGVVEFGRSIRQLRRWATEEDLGAFIGGRWHLSRSLVRRHKLVRT